MMTHAELVNRAVKWLKPKCGVVVSEYRSYAEEYPDAIGFRSNYTILIECKVSVSDFKADARKKHRLGDYRYYLVPPGMIKIDDVPTGWGLLYAKNKTISMVLEAPWNSDPAIKKQENVILYSLLRRAVVKGWFPKLLMPIDKGISRLTGEQ